MPDQICGRLITESGLGILTESGDSIVTECFTALSPGRVIKGKYSKWKPRRPYRPLYPQVPRPILTEDEELMVIAAIEDD